MEKRFFGINGWMWFCVILCMTCLYCEVYLLAKVLLVDFSMTKLIVCAIPFIILFCVFFEFLRQFLFVIVFDEKTIRTRGQIGFKRIFKKAQYSCSVEFANIKNIKIIFSSKNSKGQAYQSLGSRNANFYYLQIELNQKQGNRKYVGFLISFMTKRQRIKMIEIINQKTNSNYDYLSLIHPKEKN